MVKVELDTAAVRQRVLAAAAKATESTARQALEDCNYFARQLSGDLIDSSYWASDLAKGLLVWDRPYARRVYYTGVPGTLVNPNASTLWAHRARAVFGDAWLARAQEVFDSEFGRDSGGSGDSGSSGESGKPGDGNV